MAQRMAIPAAKPVDGADLPRSTGVYIIHFATPLKHAKHYIGYSPNIRARVAAHHAGTGARLMEVIKEEGIQWSVVGIWPKGTRTLERRLKNRHGTRVCPVCRAEAEAARAASAPLPLAA